MIFNVEESVLMASFDHSSRDAAVRDLIASLERIEDRDLEEQVCRLIDKLRKMSDEEFMQVDFTVYGEEKNGKDI